MSTAGEDIVEKIIEAFSNRWIKLILFVIALAYTLPAWLFIVNGNWANYKDINQELVPSDTLHYYYNKELNLRVSFGKSFAWYTNWTRAFLVRVCHQSVMSFPVLSRYEFMPIQDRFVTSVLHRRPGKHSVFG